MLAEYKNILVPKLTVQVSQKIRSKKLLPLPNVITPRCTLSTLRTQEMFLLALNMNPD